MLYHLFIQNKILHNLNELKVRLCVVTQFTGNTSNLYNVVANMVRREATYILKYPKFLSLYL